MIISTCCIADSLTFKFKDLIFPIYVYSSFEKRSFELILERRILTAKYVQTRNGRNDLKYTNVLIIFVV